MSKGPAETLFDQLSHQLRWPPTYAEKIAEAANRFAYLEYIVNSTIWLVADVRPAIGACLTSQMYTMNAKLSALLSLLKLRGADKKIIDALNKFSSNVRDAADARNRVAHDLWMHDDADHSKMGKLRITADKTLNYSMEMVSVAELQNSVRIINKRLREAADIKSSIIRALPSFPEIPPEALHPIVETPGDP
jgi:hypothetical protein